MNWRNLFFQLGGRLDRRRFKLAFIMVGIATAVFLLLATLVGVATLVDVPAMGIAVFFGLYAMIAIKRLHDLNRSGWWLLLFFVAPLAGSVAIAAANSPLALGASWSEYLMLPLALLFIWGFVELSFRDGTSGPNAYGPDPR